MHHDAWEGFCYTFSDLKSIVWQHEIYLAFFVGRYSSSGGKEVANRHIYLSFAKLGYHAVSISLNKRNDLLLEAWPGGPRGHCKLQGLQVGAATLRKPPEKHDVKAR